MAEPKSRRRYLRDGEWSIPETALLQRLIESGLTSWQVAAEMNITGECVKRRLNEINKRAAEARTFFKPLGPKPMVWRGPDKITLPRVEALERRPAWYFGKAS
jgi:hypothetical protein